MNLAECEDKKLNIVREHSDWLVVNKPPHFLVHPTRPDGKLTLIDQVRDHYPNETLSIINRLDRETSGLVLISRHKEAASRLGKMTMQRTIQKRYHAIVTGMTVLAASICAPLDRLITHAPSRIYVKQAIIPNTYPALTRFLRLDCKQDSQARVYSLLDLQLETGRLHQIRVHMQRVGNSVVGDKLYGPDEQCYLDFAQNGWTPALAEQLILSRQALHAYRLDFLWNSQMIHVEVSLPDDLQNFWNTLS